MTGPKNKLWLVVVMIALVVVGTWTGYRWLKGAFAGLVVDSRETYEQGRALGRTITADACLDTAFARHARLGSASFGRQVTEGVFLESCLRTSTPTAAVCESVPAADNISGMVRFSAWTIEECHRRGFNDRSCPRLLQSLNRYCGTRGAGAGGEKTPGVK